MIRKRDKVIFRDKFIFPGLALALLCLTAQAFGQSVTPKDARPKIGLALSSGSALGLAHIGVLAWFEKHHIPIDYIPGASICGLISGGFAVGMTPDELRSTLRSIEWNNVFSGEPSYRNLPLRRKEDRRDLQSKLVVGLRKGIELPNGINAANPINLLQMDAFIERGNQPEQFSSR